MQITGTDSYHIATFIISLFHHIIIGDRFANNANHLCLEISKTIATIQQQLILITSIVRRDNPIVTTFYTIKSHFLFSSVKITPTLSNVKCISKEIFESGVSQVRSKSSSIRGTLYLLSLLLRTTKRKYIPCFRYHFREENPFRRKKEENSCSMDSVKLESNWGKGEKKRWEHRRGGYKIAEVTAQAEVPIAS